MIDWNIQSRAHACQGCRKAFVDKETYHTLLFDQKNAYERLDVCDPCWKNQFSGKPGDRGALISYWQGVFTVPPAGAPDPIQKETAETLLRKLVEQNDPSHAAARFVLAAMLERKRLLKVKGQLVEDERRVFLYEHSKTGDLLKIADPNLRLDQLEDVQRDVAHLLEHGLEPPTPVPPTLSPNGSALPDAAAAAATESAKSAAATPSEPRQEPGLPCVES